VNTTLAGKAPWVISTADPATTLEIVLQKQTVVLSWHQFVYAEGDSEHVLIAFASHDVAIEGAGLDPLLPAIASHRVVSLRESVRSERFSSLTLRFISAILVRRVESES
jgi:hypothetical protein